MTDILASSDVPADDAGRVNYMVEHIQRTIGVQVSPAGAVLLVQEIVVLRSLIAELLPDPSEYHSESKTFERGTCLYCGTPWPCVVVRGRTIIEGTN